MALACMIPPGYPSLKFLFVNFGFLILIFYIVIAREIKKIKQQWPLYRCNPSYMLLADNIYENYNYCLTQTSKMSFNKLSPKVTQNQKAGFDAQFKSNDVSVRQAKAHNKFGGSVNLTLSSILSKGGKLTTIGALFAAQIKGIMDNFSGIANSFGGSLNSGISGLSVLNNKFASFAPYFANAM
jgi:hypothetical protein